MNSHLLLRLADAGNLEEVGGKAFALGKMIQAGFTVPEGFVITIAVDGQMTAALKEDVLAAFDTLNAAFVAVRSSATAEDGASDAWAGQLDTFLNVTKEDLVERIQMCWDSANSDRARAYAAQKLLESGGVAVIVQKMVQSDVSGVAFSVHPVTHNSEQVIIEAGLGLGEAIVSGQITPDTYITDKNTHVVLEKHVANQTKKFAQDQTGKTVWIDTAGAGQKQKLTDDKITELSRIILQLEQYFGYAVDVEWAFHEGSFFILQSRPVTTL